MSGINREILLEAPVDKVWDFLTEPSQVEQWLMPSDLSPEEGHRFTFDCPPSGNWDGRIFCEVQEVVHQKRLSYSWNADDIGCQTIVTFEIEKKGDATLLRLTHDELENATPGAYGRHEAGWHRALNALSKLFKVEPQAFDWSEIKIDMYFDADVEKTFEFLRTGEGFERFLVSAADNMWPDGRKKNHKAALDIGDRFSWKFFTGNETSGEILNFEEDKFILFSFGDVGWVRITLSEAKDRTLVSLSHFGLANTEEDQWHVHVNFRGWWMFYMMNWKSVVCHCHDLRDRSEETAGSLSLPYRPDGEDRTIDWTVFDIFCQVDAAPEKVFQAWSTKAGLESFFIRQIEIKNPEGENRKPNEIVSEGDTYAWKGFHDWSLTGKFLTIDPQVCCTFTFGDDSNVTVTIQPSGDGSLVHLRQWAMVDEPGLRMPLVLNCRSCWIFFFAALKARLQFDVEIRDTNPKTASSESLRH